MTPESKELLELSNSLKEQEQSLRKKEDALKAREDAMKQRKAVWEKKKVDKKVKQLNRVFEKMAVEYDMRTTKLMERVSPAALDSMIAAELKNNGVTLPYSLKLHSGPKDSIVWSDILQDRLLPGMRKCFQQHFFQAISSTKKIMSILVFPEPLPI